MSTDRLIGHELGRYRIDALVGRGGMGSVYRAQDTKLERTVALKVLSERYAHEDAFRQRFLRESHLLASIDHPNIIPVYEADEVDGELYIAMRFVEGPELGDLVRQRGALPPAQAVSIISQVADGLDYAHSRGLVHRDVKPANIMIVEGATAESPVHAYLTDFGLTKVVGASGGLTETGGFVGTSEYIAPEQIQGKPVDHRADIYALGCVLYDLLTGAVPFPRDSTHASLWAHVNEPPPKPSRTRDGVSPEFDAVISTALAKDPAERYQTAGGLALAAREALHAGGATEATPRRKTAQPTEIRAVAGLAAAETLGAADGPRPPGPATELAPLVDPAATVMAAGAATELASWPSPATELSPPGGSGGGSIGSPGGGNLPPRRRGRLTMPVIGAGVLGVLLVGTALAVGTGGFGLAASPTSTPLAQASRVEAGLPTATPSSEPLPSDSPAASGDVPPGPSAGPTPPQPTDTPKATPKPGAADTTGPAGGAVSVNAGKGVTTSTKVTLAVSKKPTDPSGVTQMAISNSSTRPKGIAYKSSVSWTISGGQAGTRTVYVWFRDGKGNWSGALTDSITYDRAPVDHAYHWDLRNNSNYCGTYIDFTLPGYAVTDPDGNQTITITRAWSATAEYPITGGTIVRTGNPPKPFAAQSYVFNYTAKDDHGVSVTGKVYYQVGPCS